MRNVAHEQMHWMRNVAHALKSPSSAFCTNRSKPAIFGYRPVQFRFLRTIPTFGLSGKRISLTPLIGGSLKSWNPFQAAPASTDAEGTRAQTGKLTFRTSSPFQKYPGEPFYLNVAHKNIPILLNVRLTFLAPRANSERRPHMPARKKPDNSGQQFLGEVQRAADEAAKERPRGMPCLQVIQSEALRLGLTKADADYLYDRWMMNGFTQGRQKIKSWRHALHFWKRNGWLPSQKGVKPAEAESIYPTRERVEFWCTKRKVRPMIDRAWGELMGGRFRGRLITNNEDFLAAMEVIKAQWLKEP